MKILYLTPRLSSRVPTGESLHNRRVLEHLLRDHQVAVLTAGARDSPPSLRAEARMAPAAPERGGVLRAALACLRGGVWSYCPDYSLAFERAVARAVAGERHDLVWADGYSCAPYLRRVRGVASILMTRDSQARYHHTRNLVQPSARARLAERRLRWFESRFYREASRVVFLNHADAAFYRRSGGIANAAIVPQGIDVGEFAPAAEGESATILFTGAMDYAPNANAAIWFAREILPLIVREEPGAEFVVAGHSPGRDVTALSEPGRVRVTGYVEDVGSFVRQARVFVSPLRFGAGVKTKMLEAMAMGKAIVATPLSVEGIQAEDGRDVLLAATAEEIVHKVLILLRDPVRRAALGANARRAVETHHNWSVHFRHIDSLIDEVTRGGPSLL